MKTGEIRTLLFQQYEIGLYVADYNERGEFDSTFDQYGLDCTKDEFISELESNPNYEVLS